MFIAAKNGFTDVVKELAKAGAEVNKANIKRETPLHIAVSEYNREMVETLLSLGASLAIKDKQRKTPLQLAQQLEDEAIIELFTAGKKQ